MSSTDEHAPLGPRPATNMTEGVLHVYHPGRNLNLFEHRPHPHDAPPVYPPPVPKHVLLFVGGLFDTFNTPRYVNDLSRLFALHDNQTWRVMHVQLSSAGRAFGVFDLDRDIEEIAVCITYLRETLYNDSSLNVILMGHSTGCQDIMRYLTAPNPLGDRKPKRPAIQGAILQAPVSDRDSVMHKIGENDTVKQSYDAAMKLVAATDAKDHRDSILPMNLTRSMFGPAPLSIARFLSLLSPSSPRNPSSEDFFSADLPDTHLRTTFGSVAKTRLLSPPPSCPHTPSILMLLSDSDEHAHPAGGMSQRELLNRWKSVMNEGTGATVHGDSAVILNALHDVGGDDWPSQEARLVVLRKKVIRYLRDIVGHDGVDHSADEVWHAEGDKVMKEKQADGKDVEAMVGVLKL